MIEFVFDRADLTKDKEYINLLSAYLKARSELLVYMEKVTKIRVFPAMEKGEGEKG